MLELFRNRAELKKAYGGLQDEIFRLKDRIKQQEGATQRVQEMLNALEGRLGATETAYARWCSTSCAACGSRAASSSTQFAGDLARQQEERERRAHLAAAQPPAVRQAAGRREAAAPQPRPVRDEAQCAAGRAWRPQRAALTRFWHYFKRRALARQRRCRAHARVGTAERRARAGPAGRRGDRARGRPRSSPGSRWRRAAPSTLPRSPMPKCCACAWRRSRPRW